MQFSFGEVSAVISIFAGFGVIIYKFAKLEGRVDRLEEKVDEILYYLTPKFKRKKKKHLYSKR